MAERRKAEREEKAGERVCVIGVEVKKQLFGGRVDVVGRPLAINSLPYRIIGVMADKNQNSSYSGQDEKKIWLPYTTVWLAPSSTATPPEMSTRADGTLFRTRLSWTLTLLTPSTPMPMPPPDGPSSP